MGSPPKPSKPPSMSQDKVQQAADDEARRLRMAKSKKSTILQDMYKSTFGG